MGESHMFQRIDTVSTFYNRKMYKKKNNYFYSDVLEFRDIYIVIER